MKRQLLRFVSISLIFVLCCIAQIVRAQQNGGVIYSGENGNAQALDWSPDSRYLYFATYINFEYDGARALCLCWYQFDVLKWTLNSSNVWFRQPQLTTKEIAAFYPGLESSQFQPLIFVSPNDRYIVYPSKDYPPTFRLGDRKTLTYFNLHIPVVSNYMASVSDVIWSPSNSAFILAPEHESQYVGYYVGRIRPGARTLVIKRYSFGDSSTYSFNEIFLVTKKIYDISEDGSTFIASGENTWFVGDSTISIPVFVIRNVSNPEKNDQLGFSRDDPVITARLVGGNPPIMLVLAKSTILKYNLDTHTSSTLTIDTFNSIAKLLNAFDIKEAKFSPDGHWLAFVRGQWLYVVRLWETF